MSESDYLLGLLDVLLNAVVRAVEHDGGEAGLDALECALIGAVIKVKRNGNGDSELVVHSRLLILKCPTAYLPAFAFLSIFAAETNIVKTS